MTTSAEYPASMPLPSWAANAAAKIKDHDNLVFIEGTLQDPDGESQSALALAHLSTTSGPEGRSEFHVLAVMTDVQLQDMLDIHKEDARVYPFPD